MATRLYVVEDRTDKTLRLVRATYKLMALRHAASKRYSARIATKDDIESLLTKGVQPELANEEQLASEAMSE